MAKRKIEEVDLGVSEITTASDNAKIYGIVTELSPIKMSQKNQKYFSGRLSDGKKSVRVLCFEPSLHKSIEKSRLEKNPIA